MSGVQDADGALEGGFCLRDGKLLVCKLMYFILCNARLAFCSACDAAKGDSEQPDRTVHLAAAMLFVRFKSVVTRMWCVRSVTGLIDSYICRTMGDMDGLVAAKTVYRQLLESDTLNLGVAPFALDAAVRELRENGVPPAAGYHTSICAVNEQE